MNLVEEIKMLTDLFEDGYITENELSDLIAKASKKFQAKEKEAELDWCDTVDINESFDFVDQESNVPYSDDKDDFDLWKERNGISEDERFNRYVYKGEVYWMKAGSDEEKMLLVKIYDEKRLVNFPSDPLNNTFYLTRNYPKVDIGGRGILDCPSITSLSDLPIERGGRHVGWTNEGHPNHPKNWYGVNNHSTLHNKTLRDEVNAITIESLKGTIQSSEHNE